MSKIGLLALSLIVSAAHAQTPCTVIPADAQDAIAASPANHTVLFEDEDVRVLDVHSQPHTRETPHTHSRPGVMYVDSQGAGTMNTPDGKGNSSHPTDPGFKPRIIVTKPQGLHWTENTGEVPFHAIRVEFKHPGCGLPGWKPAAPGPEDALTAAPDAHTLLYEDANVRVLDVHIAPHGQDSFHTHPWAGIFYVVQASEVRTYAKNDAEPQLRKFPHGVKVLPSEAEAHRIENLSDQPLHLVRFELKFATPGAVNTVKR